MLLLTIPMLMACSHVQRREKRAHSEHMGASERLMACSHEQRREKRAHREQMGASERDHCKHKHSSFSLHRLRLLFFRRSMASGTFHAQTTAVSLCARAAPRAAASLAKRSLMRSVPTQFKRILDNKIVIAQRAEDQVASGSASGVGNSLWQQGMQIANGIGKCLFLSLLLSPTLFLLFFTLRTLLYSYAPRCGRDICPTADYSSRFVQRPFPH